MQYLRSTSAPGLRFNQGDDMGYNKMLVALFFQLISETLKSICTSITPIPVTRHHDK